MTVPLRSPSLALLIAWSATACVLPDLDLEGLECPCAPGFTCDTATNTCVTGEGGSTGALPPDATSTGASTGDGGTSSDGGAPAGPGGGPPSVGGAGGSIGDGGFGTGGAATGGAPPTGGTCDAPVDIPDPGSALGTTVDQGNDLAGNCVDAAGPDVVYTVTAAETGTLDLTLFSAAELHLYVRTACDDGATEVACVDKGGINAFEVASISVTQGQTVFVIVDGHGGEQSDFSLDVVSHP